jgi:putative DNA primase/helicase
MRDAIEQFRDAIRAAGLTPPDDIRADGDIHRFSTSGKPRDDAGYYVLHLDGIPAGHFGCWRTGLSENWQADIGRTLTPEEREANRKRMAELKAQREAEEAKRRAAAAHMAGELWKAGTPAGEDHPYLVRKGVQPVETLRELPADEVARVIGYRPQASGEPLTGRVLLAPVKIDGKLSTVEMIDEAGRKSALYGGAKSGGWWAAQPLSEGDGAGLCILIGEGVATALSAREATEHLALSALSAGQLEAAAKAARKRYPAAAIAILADLLKDTGEPDPRAVQAARAVGGTVAVPDFGGSREAGDTDFNDLAARWGLEAVRKAVAAAISASGTEPPTEDAKAAGVDSCGWPTPQPLRARIESEPYPLDALPNGIQAAVQEVAGFVQAPLALVASAALAALSLAAQARADVKRAERLQGPAALFMLTIADSGERKTTCDSFFTSAIREYEAEQAEVFKPIVKKHEAAMAAWNAEREGILSAIKDAGKKGKPTDKQRADLTDLEHDKPEPPRVPRLIYGDATPEALTWGLAKQWPSAGIVSSEAAAIFGSHGMGRESIMRNLGILNTLWDGVSQRFDRRTSESYTVRGARLTVALQVQEATLRDFFGRSGALARGSGFLARFLVAWPESTQGQRPFTEAPAAWPALAAFHRRIAAILAEPVQLHDDGGLTPPVLGFKPEARRDWIAFHDAIESELRSGGELHDVRDVAAKAADNAARLAALFHAYAGGAGSIGSDAFTGASRIVAWHLNEARRFFGELALPAELADAARLDAWLIEQCRRDRTDEVLRREAQRCGPVRDAERLSAALRVLAELDRVRAAAEGKRRPVRVNPALLTGADR